MLHLVISSPRDSARNHCIMAYTTFKYANVDGYGCIIRALCSKFGRHRTERLINNTLLRILMCLYVHIWEPDDLDRYR